MGLFFRMALYLVFAGLAGAGVGSFEQATGDFTVNADDLALTLLGLAGYAGTFVWSRIAKRRGGLT